MKVFIAKIFVWFLRKLKISVMIGAEINAEEKICTPKFNVSFVWYTNLKGMRFKDWKEYGFCGVRDLKGENVTAFQMTTKRQGED